MLLSYSCDHPGEVIVGLKIGCMFELPEVFESILTARSILGD